MSASRTAGKPSDNWSARLSSDPARPKARIPDCPLARTAGVIGHWWTLEILHEVFDVHTRFESICRNLASPADVLLDRITELIAKGLLDTEDGTAPLAEREY